MKRPRDLSLVHPDKRQKCKINVGNLLDFTSCSDISVQFDQLAETILHHYSLCVHVDDQDIEYEILELELYLYKPGCHEDPFTHQSEEQKHTGHWYFHRAHSRSNGPTSTSGSAPGYRGGTRKGLDLTFGHPITSPHFASDSSAVQTISNTRGGILLRTIRRITNGKLISGPSLLVDEILSASKADSISDLVQNKWGNDTTALCSPSSSKRPYLLYLRQHSQKEPRAKLYRTPRIGLELSHPSTTTSPTDSRLVYISKPYRYIIHPHLLTSNGRCQTFLGMYRTCLDSGEFDGLIENELAAEISRITAIKEKTVLKYISDFRFGMDGHCSLNSFVGTKNGAASVTKHLNMMGALWAFLKKSDQGIV